MADQQATPQERATRSLRITCLNQFYPPDGAPTGRYLHQLVQALARRGHRIQVLTSSGAYGRAGGAHEVLEEEGVRVERLAAPGFGRLIDHLAYAFLASCRLLSQPKADCVLILTSPPFLGAMAGWAARRRRSSQFHWVMDLYPDCLAAHGWPRRGLGGAAYALLRRLAAWQWSPAAGVAVLGGAMRQRLAAYRRDAVTVVPLWTQDGLSPWPAAEPVPLRAERGWDDGTLTLCYSGNLGNGHAWREFAQAAEQLAQESLRWVFCGSGAGHAALRAWAQAHPSVPISFLPAVPAARLREHLCSIDLHLASMAPGWEGCIVPSKVQNVLAVGGPLLVVAPSTCEPFRWVQDSGGGWAVVPGDVAGVVAAIREAMDPLVRQRRGAAGAHFARQRFDPQRQLAAMVDWIEAGCAATGRDDT